MKLSLIVGALLFGACYVGALLFGIALVTARLPNLP